MSEPLDPGAAERKLARAHFKPYFCQECGEPCDITLVDFGIGPHEFWGQRGNDTNKQMVSDCCEATCLDENGSEVDFSE